MVSLSLSSTPDVPIVFSRITAAEYAQVRRLTKKTTPEITWPLRKQRGQLTIPTNHGLQIYRDVVIDEAALRRGRSEDETTHYTYHGFLPHFRRHVVEVAYYETAEWWLIGNDGRRLTLYGPPQYSPDQQRIATICPGIEYSGGQPNALQLFQMRQDTLRKVWELRPTTWEPAEVCWLNNNTLYLKRATWAGAAQGSVSYWKLTIRSAD